MATKENKVDWDKDSFDLMPEKKQNRILNKWKTAILEAKKTPAGRRRLAGAFGGKPSKYMPSDNK